jgi:RNase P/RNase MRP subunit p29
LFDYLAIPKTENVFDIQLANPEGTVKIAGNSFITRPAERASKKVKSFIEFVGVRKYKSQLRYGC